VSPRETDASFDASFLCYVHCKGKEPSMSRYYLSRYRPLQEHIANLCRRFLIPDPQPYALRVMAYVPLFPFPFPSVPFFSLESFRVFSLLPFSLPCD
jgi:hypothetical protein